MSLIVNCPSCHADTKVDFDSPGGIFECPQCGEDVKLPRSQIQSGETLGGFQVEKLLGVGGMGDVFLATQLSMNRPAALKVLPPAFTFDKEAVDRFLQEVRMTARFEHPNIVTVFEAGEEKGCYYLAMGFVEGEDLDVVLRRRKRFPERDALEIILKIAGALRYAWDKGKVLHRDIKPANIMLDASGEVQLMDLGIAKSLHDRDSAETQTGYVVGTPFYMSPEQARGKVDLDFHTDMYSLGATLFHLVVGEPPYDGDGPVEIMTRHINDPIPSARERNSEVSAGCDYLLRQMMKKTPEKRPATWDELIHDMERVQMGKLPMGMKRAQAKKAAAQHKKHSPAAPRHRVAAPVPVPPPKSNTSPLIMGAVAVGLLIVVVVVVKLTTPAPPPPPNNIKQPGLSTPTVAQQAQATARQQQREKVRRELNRLLTYAATHANEYATIQGRFMKVAQQAKGTGLEPQVARERNKYQQQIKQKINDAVQRLEQHATKLAKKGKLKTAIQLCARYDGPFAAETAEQRKVMVRRFRRQLKAATLHSADKKLFDEWMARVIKGMLAGHASDKLQGWIDALMVKINRKKLPEDALSTLKELETIARLNQGILTSFKRQIGKEITLDLISGPSRFTLTGIDVKKQLILGEKRNKYVRMSLKIPFAKLSPKERYLRLKGIRQDEADILRGLLLIDGGRREKARQIFLQSPLFVGRALAEQMMNAADTNEPALPEEGSGNAKLNRALVDLLKIVGLTPDALTADPPPNPSLTPEVRRRLVQALQQFAATYGDTQEGKRILALLTTRLAAWKKNQPAQPAAADLATLFADVPQSLLRFLGLLAKNNPKCKITRQTVLDYEQDENGEISSLKLRVNQISRLDGICSQLPKLTSLALIGPKQKKRRSPGRIKKPRRAPLQDLSPLAGLHLTSFSCIWTEVTDLSPLRNMKLEYLNISGSPVKSINSLERAQLNTLIASQTRLRSFDVLARMPLVRFDCNFTNVSDLKPLAGLADTMKFLHCAGTRVRRLDPLKDLALTELDVSECPIKDLSPLREMPLTTLKLRKCSGVNFTMLKKLPLENLDLSETNFSKLLLIEDCPLVTLNLKNCQLSNLRSLRESQIISLDISGTKVRKLDDLADCPLEELDISHTRTKDLTPLVRCPLRKLVAADTEISDLLPLKAAPLTYLDIQDTRVSDLSALAGKDLHVLILGDLKVKSLKPLANTMLETLVFSHYSPADNRVLKKIQSLKTLNGKPYPPRR